MKSITISLASAVIATAGTTARAELPSTVGPNGESPTPVANLTLSDAEIARFSKDSYTAALFSHELDDWSNALAQGSKDEFARQFTRLGIEVVADEACNIGVYAARAAAAGLLDRDVEPFLVVDALSIGKNHIVGGWMQSLHREAPESLR